MMALELLQEAVGAQGTGAWESLRRALGEVLKALTSWTTLFRIGIASILAIYLTGLAERKSMHWAAILSAFPNVSLVTILFIGQDQGNTFSAEASTYAIYGLMADMAFAAAMIGVFSKLTTNTWVAVPIAATSYLLVVLAATTELLPTEAMHAFGVCVLFWAVLLYLLRSSKIAHVGDPVKSRSRMFLLQFLVASFTILTSTGIASAPGDVVSDLTRARYSGITASIAGVTLSIALLIYLKYGPRAVQHFLRSAIIAWLPTAFYFMCYAYASPVLGMKYGTLVSAALAVMLILLIEFRPRLLAGNRPS